MKAYMKGYYGYRNLGDELLLVGVLHYIQDTYDIHDLCVEVQDVEWMKTRQERNRRYFPTHIHIHRVPVPSFRAKIVHMFRSMLGVFPLLILGGGEVINTISPFPHNGRNYILIYRGMIIRRRYILLGGITTRGKDDKLAKYIVSHAQRIVVRDTGSERQARWWSEKITLFEDFAKTTIRQSLKKKSATSKTPYILVNIHPSRTQETTRKKIDTFVHKYNHQDVYFVPCDMRHDMTFFDEIYKRYPSWKLYDRTEHSIDEIVSFFSHARSARGMRLHFLLLCHECGVEYDYLVYHDKVSKVLQLR